MVNNNSAARTEWVAVVHGQTGTYKIAAPNAASMLAQLEAQTKAGYMVASVYQREATVYTNEEMGR